MDDPKMSKGENQGRSGKWIPAACWHNCGGRCLIYAYVENGIVKRIKTDDTHPDSPDFPQLRACPRGRAQIGQVLGADRLKYPLKRKHWAPGGGNKALRGRDQWERISWDEALDIVASETRRILDKYGNKSLLVLSWEEIFQAMLWDPVPRVFNHLGGFIGQWGTVSLGSFPFPSIFMQGGMYHGNDRLDLLNSKLILLWGNNPAVNRAGNSAYHFLRAKRAGAKIIVVDPIYNESARALADQWIPVRPGTDAALLLGIAHHMITNNLQDQAFLDAYTVGFDAAHMPEGVNPKDNFKDYVLGTYDGMPKTPQWASAICGTDPETIRDLAQQMATVKPAAIISAWSVSKSNRGEQFAQAFFTVGWMTGNIGIPGGQVNWAGHPYGDRPLVKLGRRGDQVKENPLLPRKSKIGNYFPIPFDPDWEGLNWSECWDAVLKGEYGAGLRGRRPIDIRMIYHGHAAMLNQMPDLNKGIDAHRKVEFVVSASQFMATNARYSDVILPVTTLWERYGDLIAANTETVLWWQKVIEPLYEAKDDMFIARGLAKRLGLDPEAIESATAAQRVYNQLAGAKVIMTDGSGYEPLLTITEKEMAEMGVKGSPQSGRIPLAEFKEKGIYQVPRKPGDPYGYVAHAEFRKNPKDAPVGTASGKLEIYCKTLADMVNAYGWSNIDPIAKYAPPIDGYEAARGSTYPLQMITPHHLRRAHSTMDNVPFLREAFPQECWINIVDAKNRRLKNGDTILVKSPHGALLRRVKATPAIMPGVIALADGAWVEKDETTGIDKGGAPNSVQAPPPSGHGVQTWSTTRVEVEKYDTPLEPDHLWPQRIVESHEEIR
jgi:anaerobic dimethyl sulfoxide reductase subunit A